METKERYDELCRLCASYDAVKMDIFGKEGKNRQLVDKIQTCLPFKIDEDDRLPKCLCYRCMYNLENFYDFRTACVNAVALLERCLPSSIDSAVRKLENDVENYSELRTELLKEKEKMPILIPEAPIVNPNAALGTPPRLNSDGEADPDVEEVVDASGTEDGFEDTEDRKSDEYEMDMETNPSDFLEMTPMVTDELEDNETAKTAKTENRNSDVFQHTAEQHEVYVCSLCNKAFSSKGHLSLHARIHVGAGDVIGAKVVTDDHTSYKRPYQCDLCNKSYSTAKHRWGHVSTTHRGHPAVTCAYCSRIYSTRTNLEEHIKSRHTGLPPPPELPIPYVQPDNKYKCKTCPKMYTTVTELNKHGRVCLGDGSKEKTNKKICRKTKNVIDTSDLSSTDTDIDGKDYRNAEAKLSKNPQLTILKQALTMGENSKRDYDEKNSSNYKIVELPKTGVNEGDGQKRWYCEICPQNFSSVDKLKDHETIHDAERPYICILCEKDFVVKSSLSRHILSSHGVDPTPIIDSDKCLKKSVLSQSQWSRRSIKTESKTRPRDGSITSEDGESGHGNTIEIETVFVCEICTRDFNDRASLWLHIRATHKKCAAFACGVCLKICSDNAQLLNHVNMYHGGSKLLISEQRRYSCTICGRQHDSRKKLMTHVSIHNVDPGYDPASFVQLNSNYYNENVNSNEPNEALMDFDVDDCEKVDCYICYKSFPNEDHLIRHQRNAHKSEPVIPSGGDTLLPPSNGSGVGVNGTKAQYHLFFVCELCGSSHPSKWERWLHVSGNHSEEPSIKCEREDCGKIFATKTLRNDHAQHHLIQGSSPNTCEVCGKLWGSRVDYWKHVMGVHSDTVPLICGVCLKVFPDVVKLSDHVKSSHWPLTNGDFSCDVCGRPYSNKSKMSRHRKIHGLELDNPSNNGTTENPNNGSLTYEKSAMMDTELTCELCAESIFYNWESLCNHRRSIHGLFPCDLCNKCYGRTSHLWKHVNRVHKGHKDVTCRYCMKTSASKDHLAAHISKIHRYEPYNKLEIRESTNYKQTTIEDEGIHHCDKCNKGFHKRYLLRRHMTGCQNYRKDPGALLTRCRACERIFKDRASLQKHIENHHSSYTCHLCDETVTSKLGIMTHNRVNHMDHPDLTCDNSSCKKLFRTKEDLESHRKDHKYHNSPNVCDFCGDTVDNKLKLKMHVLSLHRNEIGVSCGVCLIPMKDPKVLKKHVEDEHTGVLLKPNTCQVCGKQYASKWKAFDHTKKCHGKVFRTCKQCLAVFTTDTDIRHHYEHVHNVPKDQLAGFEKRLQMRPEDYENSDVAVKDEPEDYDYDDAMCDDENQDLKRRRNDTHDCDICPEIFLNRETLSDHYTNVHNKDPRKMFKKMKLESATSKRKMRNRENFECKNCGKQFCTKTLFWNHINVCTRRNSSSREETTRYSGSILEAHLKNNNKIKKEPVDAIVNESNLNIPDFNLFEDINMQLSEQKPVPNLMPLSQMRHLNSLKCSRKDSRKVYDESTNTVCTCEVCGKPWPAKKHLWQHLIRFHRAEAAVTCGVCLKLCGNYEELAEHLKTTHESILSCEGNNFTCKTCGRYHNARSKLLLHMSIHINGNGVAWCPKCEQSFESEDRLNEHLTTCDKRQPDYEDHSIDLEDLKHEDDDKGSLIGDGASLTGDADFSDHRRSNSDNTEDSDSSSSSSSSAGSVTDDDGDDDDDHDGKEDDVESRTNSRATGEPSCHTDTDEDPESDDEHPPAIEKKQISETVKSETLKNVEENVLNVRVKSDNDDSENADKDVKLSTKNAKENSNCDDETKLSIDAEDSNDDDDDDGPPILSPVMPLSLEHEADERDDAVGHKLSPMVPIKHEPKVEASSSNENPTESMETNDHPETTNYSEGEVNPENDKPSNEDFDTDEDADGELVDNEHDQMDDEDSRIHVVNPDDEYHSDDVRGSDESAAEEEQFYDEEQSEIEVVEDDEDGEIENDEDDDEIENGMHIHDLDGTVLMVAKDADGNQILIQKNVSDIVNGETLETVTGFIYEDDTDFDGFRGFQVEHVVSDHVVMQEVEEGEFDEEAEGEEEEAEEAEEGDGQAEEEEEEEEEEAEAEAEEGEEEENLENEEVMEEEAVEGSKDVQEDEQEELSDHVQEDEEEEEEEEEEKEEEEEEGVEEEEEAVEEEKKEEGEDEGEADEKEEIVDEQVVERDEEREDEESDVQDCNTSAKSDVSRT